MTINKLSCLFLLLIFNLSINSQVTWVDNGHVYQYFGTDLTWADAKVACETATFDFSGKIVNGHLATISSQAENDFIFSLIPPGLNSAWLGATDQAVEGTWEWVTGEPFAYTNWEDGAGEPNGGLGENCMEIFGTFRPPNEASEWNDADCSGMVGYICEFDAPAAIVPTLGQWGLMILFLLLTIVGLVTIRNREKIYSTVRN